MELCTPEVPQETPIEKLRKERDEAREAIFATMTVDESLPIADVMRHRIPKQLPMDRLGDYCKAVVSYLQARIDAARPGYDSEADRILMLYTCADRYLETGRGGREATKTVIKGMYDKEHNRENEYQLGLLREAKRGGPRPLDKPEARDRLNYLYARAILVTEMGENLFGKAEMDVLRGAIKR